MGVKKGQSLLHVEILGCGPISQFAHLESAEKGAECCKLQSGTQWFSDRLAGEMMLLSSWGGGVN
jgi:hypothetical protein